MKKIKVNKKGSTLFILYAYIVLAVTILGFTFDLCRTMYYKTYLKNLATTISVSVTNRCHYVNSDALSSAADRINVIIMDEELRKAIEYDMASLITEVANKETVLKQLYDYHNQIEPNESVTVQYYPYLNPGYSVPYINPDNVNFEPVFAGQDYFEKLLYAQKINGANGNMLIADNLNRGNIEKEFGSHDFILDLKESRINREVSTSTGMSPELVNAYKQAYAEQLINEFYGDIRRLNRYTHGKDGQNGEVEIFLKGYVKNFFLGGGFFSGMPKYTTITTVATAQPQVYVKNLSVVDNNSGNSIFDDNLSVLG